jgi:hypothetical protein
MLTAYGPDPYTGPSTRARRTGGESWSRWRVAGAAHTCYAVSGWPASPSPDLISELAASPAAIAVCTSVTVGQIRSRDHDPGPLALRVLLRVVAAPSAVDQCERQLNAAARRLGISLTRLDGEQAEAVYATTPTAAPHGWGWPW